VGDKIHVHGLIRQFVKWSISATAAASITVFVSDNTALADIAPKRRVDDYLVREIDYSRQNQKLSISQGFGVLRNSPPARGGGDRTGAYLWSGGIELGATILDKQLFDVSGKRVVDLGTGTGIVGMSCILAGAGEVVMTDGATEILSIATKNVRDNFDILSVEDPSSSLSGKYPCSYLVRKWILLSVLTLLLTHYNILYSSTRNSQRCTCLCDEAPMG